MNKKDSLKTIKMLKAIGIIAKHTTAQHHLKDLKSLVDFLASKNKKVLMDESIADHFSNKKIEVKSRIELLRECDAAIVMGGDGTLLKTAADLHSQTDSRKDTSIRRKAKNPLIIGVNLGNLGFLMELQLTELLPALDEILEGKYIEDERSLLEIIHLRNGRIQTQFIALNDAVINQGGFARLVELAIGLQGKNILTFRGDGLIISTPTGSTGHSLSAGGPIVHPVLSAFVLTPLCPATLSLRPIIIPDDSPLTITINRCQQPIVLTADGQNTVILENSDEIKIQKSHQKLRLIHRINQKNYYEVLREKLHWGKRPE